MRGLGGMAHGVSDHFSSVVKCERSQREVQAPHNQGLSLSWQSKHCPALPSALWGHLINTEAESLFVKSIGLVPGPA